MVTGLVVVVFTAFAGLDSERFPTATTLTIVAGFLVPFGYLKYQQRLHSKAWAREYSQLRGEYVPRA